jgi:hypothetical protein
LPIWRNRVCRYEQMLTLQMGWGFNAAFRK